MSEQPTWPEPMKLGPIIDRYHANIRAFSESAREGVTHMGWRRPRAVVIWFRPNGTVSHFSVDDYSVHLPEPTDTAHAVALERERIAAWFDREDSGETIRALSSADNPFGLPTIADAIRNGDHWKDGR